MLFSAPEFIFGYLPITFAAFLVLVRISRVEIAIAFLALASLVFYGWWNPVYVPLLLASIAFNFGMGLAIQRADAHRKLLLVLGVVGDLLLLGHYKYTGFLIETVNQLFGWSLPVPEIELPLGISFFTFTQIAFLADSYVRKARETDPWKYGLFVTYFPHLIAGPVLHHKEMMSQFGAQLARQDVRANISVGLTMFAFGLFKKVVIADSLSPMVGSVFDAAGSGASLTFWEAWAGALAYTLQIYFDFSGYSEMALGLSRMFGIKLPANFNSPYRARDIIDFWRRWHMTLSRFLRDYLYVPLGGNRRGRARRYVNLMLTMVLGGLWHGAGWTFVLWGALHGAYLCVNHAYRALMGGTRLRTPLAAFGTQMVTFMAVVSAWVFFRASDIGSATAILHAMAGGNGVYLPVQFAGLLGDLPLSFGGLWPNVPPALEPSLTLVFVLLLLPIAWFAPSAMQVMRRADISLDPEQFEDVRWRWRPSLGWAALVALALACSFVRIFTAAPTEFLYFQF